MFEPRQYAADNGDQLNYRLLKPADHTPGKYDANEKYPLVLFLHGAGERGSDNAAQLKHCMIEFCKPERRERFPLLCARTAMPRRAGEIGRGRLEQRKP